MAFALGAGSGLAGLLVGPRLRGPKARAVLALLTMGIVALALAWVTSQISPAWATRYLSVLLGPLLLLGGAGLSRAGTLGLVVAAILAVLWLNPRTHALERRATPTPPPSSSRTASQPGDLVVAVHPEQGPVDAPLPAEGPALGERDGPVADPRIMDWRDALQRLKDAKPTPTEDALVKTLKPNQRLLAVFPIIRSAQWGAPWTKLVRTRSARWQRVLDRDQRLSRVLADAASQRPPAEGRAARALPAPVAGVESRLTVASPVKVASVPVSIVIADDHAMVRSGLRVLLDSEPDLNVVAEAGDVEHRARVRAHAPARRRRARPQHAGRAEPAGHPALPRGGARARRS